MKNIDIVILCSYFLIAGQNVFKPVHGQNQTYEATPKVQFLQSPGYPINYGSNMTWSFLLTTKYPNHTVLATLSDCEIEYEEKLGNCLYDTLSVFDGPNENATRLEEVCCVKNKALPSFASSNNSLYGIFNTDGAIHKKGFNMSFVSVGLTTTTSIITSAVTKETTSTVPTVPTTSTLSPDVGPDADKTDKHLLYVIAGSSAAGGLLLLIVLSLVVYKLCHCRPSETVVIKQRMGKTNSSNQISPVVSDTLHLDEVSSVDEKVPAVLEMDLPTGRANLLPPISPHMDKR